MNQPKIPYENPDIQAIAKQTNRRFLVKWLITTAVFLMLAVAFFPTAAAHYGIPVAILLALGLVILPFFACGGWEWITDRGFTGVVTELDFSVRLEMYRTSRGGVVRGSRRRYHTRAHDARQTNYCKVTACTDDDSVKTFTIRLPGDSESFPLKVGDRIVKYHGLPFPAIVGCKTPFCVVCGQMDDDGKGECRGCGCSLIVME